MLPLDSENFEDAGKRPKRKVIQHNVLRVLYANQDKALSSKELESILKVRRQGVHQGLRALEQKGYVERGMLEGEKRNTYYATITAKGVRYVEKRQLCGQRYCVLNTQTGAEGEEGSSVSDTEATSEDDEG